MLSATPFYVCTSMAFASVGVCEKEAETYRSFRHGPILRAGDVCTLVERKHKLSRVDGNLLNRIRNEWIALFVRKRLSRPYLESVHPQCQAVMSDSAVHLSYQLLSLAFANEACLEKLPCTNTVLKQHRPMSVFIYTALTDLSAQEMCSWRQISMSFAAEDDTESTFVQCAAQLSTLYAVMSQGTDPRRWSNDILTQFMSMIPKIALSVSVMCSQPSSGLFSTGKKQLSHIKELDGVVSQDSFTILSIASQCAGDQILNVHAFSMYKWCIQVSKECLSLVQQSKETVKMLNAVEKCCLRVLEQCERKPLSAQDEALTNSALAECMSILHIVCTVNEEKLHSVIQMIKQLLHHTLKDNSKRRALLNVLEFLLIHGEKASFAFESLFVDFFKDSVGEGYIHPSFAFDVLDCLLKHKDVMSEPVNYFERFFPSLFKILAWHPSTFLYEFTEIIPLMVTTKSACEVFHSIVDLPCTAAVLQLHNQSKSGSSDSTVYGQCFAALDEVRFGIIFEYFMRVEGGKGDTVDFLGSFHATLAPLGHQPRVVAAAQIVPTLLRRLFQELSFAVLPKVASSLLSGILERSVLLYGSPDYTSSIRRALAENLLSLCWRYPDLLVHNQQEIIEYLAVFQNRDSGGDDLYSSLIWVVGEYGGCTSLTLANRDIILKYHECLESVAYEVALMADNPQYKRDKNYLKLQMVLIGALAKLAGRCQEIIPRVLLCLNKVVQRFSQSSCDRDHVKILLCRASEVISVLKMPNVAVAVLFAEKSNYLDSTANLTAASFIIERASELAKLLS